jgi:hypothetical protein
MMSQAHARTTGPGHVTRSGGVVGVGRQLRLDQTADQAIVTAE